MKQRMQGMVMGMLVMVLILGTVTVSAAPRTIEVMFGNFRTTLFGQEFTVTNAAGEVLQPFSFNGTVYIPVDAVIHAMGQNAQWNPATGVLNFGAAAQPVVTQPPATVTGSTANIPNRTFFIRPRGGELYLDVYRGHRGDGTRIHLWYSNRSEAQQFRFERQANGAYRISPVVSGSFLQVRDRSQANGAQIVQWSFESGLAQQWFINDVGNGYVEFVNADSGKVIDARGGQGTNVQQFDRTNSPWQQFRLIEVN